MPDFTVGYLAVIKHVCAWVIDRVDHSIKASGAVRAHSHTAPSGRRATSQTWLDQSIRSTYGTCTSRAECSSDTACMCMGVTEHQQSQPCIGLYSWPATAYNYIDQDQGVQPYSHTRRKKKFSHQEGIVAPIHMPPLRRHWLIFINRPTLKFNISLAICKNVPLTNSLFLIARPRSTLWMYSPPYAPRCPCIALRIQNIYCRRRYNSLR